MANSDGLRLENLAVLASVRWAQGAQAVSLGFLVSLHPSAVAVSVWLPSVAGLVYWWERWDRFRSPCDVDDSRRRLANIPSQSICISGKIPAQFRSHAYP